MRERFLDLYRCYFPGNLMRNASLKFMLIPGILLLAVSAMARPAADHAPMFLGGHSQSLLACENSSAVSIDIILTVADSDVAQPETWNVNMAPTNGTLSGFPTMTISTGSMVTPSLLTYTPAPGFAGTDSFSVKVTDGVYEDSTMIYVTVGATYALTSTLTPADICSGTAFSYTPTSTDTTGTPVFNWSRAAVPGISNAAATGTGNPMEILNNYTYYAVPVTYNYSVAVGGCSIGASVTVVVNAKPVLSSASSDTVCSGTSFTYVPVSATTGATISWSRAAVAGISPATNSGISTINETLIDSNSFITNVVYTFALSANGCNDTENVRFTVVPSTGVANITTSSPINVCEGTMYQNFGTSTLLPSASSYTWTAVNADIYTVGSTGQNVLVNFPTAGNAIITLNARISSHCSVNDTFAVTVGSSSFTAADVIYYGYQFIYTDNTADTYQWGYDNVNTLDSTLIPGATFQSYPNSLPDFTDNAYWVIVTKSGCSQKIYYNRPSLAVHYVQTATSVLRVYPNPTNNVLNINIANVKGTVSVTDVLGRTIQTATITGNTTQMDVSALPAGVYAVSCFENGSKIATTRFTKN